MGRNLVLLLLGVLIFVLVTDLVQLWWVARTQYPDRGPRSRERWSPTTAGELRPGDVVLSSTLSGRVETVTATAPVGADQVRLQFRSGRSRTVDATTRVRRHRPSG